MTIRYHYDIEQGSEQWHDARRGILTGSEIDRILTPKTWRFANNDKMRGLLYEKAAQLITGFTEPSYVSDDMMRGKEDEIEARSIYDYHYDCVRECGFVTNDEWGFTIGVSPDGLVGSDGGIEIKSRCQKLHLITLLEYKVPEVFMPQIQSFLLVTDRQWCDFVSFCGGMPMVTIRVFPDLVMQEAIVAAAGEFYALLADVMESYTLSMRDQGRLLIPTERRRYDLDMELVA